MKPLLAPQHLDALRSAIEAYTVDSVQDLIGLVGRAALSRGDLRGVSRALRGSGRDRLGTLVRMFLLGSEVTEVDARAALRPLPLEAAAAAGLLQVSAGSVRALVDVRPYSEAAPVVAGAPLLDTAETAAAPSWWVVSDFGSDVRSGPLPADHVPGIGAASLTLAQATPRSPVARALDIGTGCGIQALHLSGHTAGVTVTDISTRALRMAATTAALSGLEWDLREGSLLEPVAGESFDLVVANPPFVVSDGGDSYDYRDGGVVGDEVCRALITGLPGILAPSGTAQLLANWIVPTDEDWRERLAGWVAGLGCDVWVWQREVAEPAEYVAMWLRDAGEVPGSPQWNTRYDRWLDYFTRVGVAAIGMGLVTMWRSDASAPVLVIEDVPQAVQQPIGAHLPAWIARQRWLARTGDTALLGATITAAPGLVRTRDDLLDSAGWTTAAARLRQSYGLRWDLEVDESIAALVAACDGRSPLSFAVAILAASLGAGVGEVADGVLPVVRDLIGRGFLLPPDL